jgi:hypothetical protein
MKLTKRSVRELNQLEIEENFKLYSELIKDINFKKDLDLFESQLKFSEFNKEFFKKVYLKKRRKPGQIEAAQQRTKIQGELSSLKDWCEKCKNYFFRPIQNREYDKKKDIFNAHFFENTIKDFLNKNGFNVIRGDNSAVFSNHHSGYPDLLILNKKDEPACFIEIKYNAAPFIKVSKFIKGRECYESSLTLNPPKLQRQKKLIESEIKVPVIYVYWADFPCLKGLFFTDIRNIWEYYEKFSKAPQHNRRTGVGDFNYGRKTGQTEMIYPPVLEMQCLTELLSFLKKQINNV